MNRGQVSKASSVFTATPHRSLYLLGSTLQTSGSIVNVMHLNPETIRAPQLLWKNHLPGNQSLVPEMLGGDCCRRVYIMNGTDNAALSFSSEVPTIFRISKTVQKVYVVAFFFYFVFISTAKCFCLPPFDRGNGTPLQYSCLANPMDRGAW